MPPINHVNYYANTIQTLRQFAQLTSLIRGTFLRLPPPSKAVHPFSSTRAPALLSLQPLRFDLTINYLTPSPSLTAVFPRVSTASSNDPHSPSAAASAAANTTSAANHTAMGDESGDTGNASDDEDSKHDDDVDFDLDTLLLSPSSSGSSRPRTRPATSAAASAPHPFRIDLELQPNGDIAVARHNVFRGPTAAKKAAAADGAKDGEGDVKVKTEEDAGGEETLEETDPRVKRLAKALDVCGEFGVWAEWVRKVSAGSV
jgi:hypothetical protein